MKFIVSFLIALLFSNHVFATNLCEDSCEIIITFPDGGSIQAVDAMTITFGSDGGLELGETGTVNTNPQPILLDFSAGGSLSLADGDSITFDSDGWFKLGTGGNIDYTSIAIDTTGDAMITAVGGQRTIVIDNFSILGGFVVFDGTSVTINGNVSIESGSTLSLTTDSGALGATAYSIPATSSNLTISAGGTIDLSSSSVLLSSQLNLPTGVISGGSFASLDLNLDTEPADATLGPLTVTDLTQQLLETFEDGLFLSTEDGQSCTMSAGECISATGEKYVVADGELVPEQESGGLMTPAMLFVLAGMLLLLKQRRRLKLIRA